MSQPPGSLPFDTPWYLIMKELRIIRVYHGDLDQSWWKRGKTHGEQMVERVEVEIRAATGLQRVNRRHVGNVVEFKIREDQFARAAVAVRMSFPDATETSPFLKEMLSRNLPALPPPVTAKPTPSSRG